MPKYVYIEYGDRAGYDRTAPSQRDAAHHHDAALLAKGALIGRAGAPVQVRNHDGAGVHATEGAYMRSDLSYRRIRRDRRCERRGGDRARVADAMRRGPWRSRDLAARRITRCGDGVRSGVIPELAGAAASRYLGELLDSPRPDGHQRGDGRPLSQSSVARAGSASS